MTIGQWVAALCVGAALMTAQPAIGQTPVDLELIIAIDTSGSIDEREFALQLAGIAGAFRDPDVVAAVGSGPTGRIVVSAVFWAASGYPKDATPWHVISDAQSAAAFADMVEGWPRRVEGGTGIGDAIFRSLQMIENNQFIGQRQVIDISGDGRETTFREYGIPPITARNAAAHRGMTVNGLAILSDEPDLDVYYGAEVVGGQGAFVMVAHSIEDFAEAMRKKLIREIDYKPIVSKLNGPPARS